MTPKEPITLIIADDHPIVRKGLRDEVTSDPELRLIGEASDGEEALGLIRREQPMVAVLDIAMPRLSGLDVLRRIQEQSLPVAVIMLTIYDDEEIFTKAIDSGAMGYILKDSAEVDIIRGIKHVVQGRYFISPALAGGLVKSSPALDAQMEKRLRLHLLTPAERRVLRLIAEDKSSKEIAEELGVSVRTVNTHRVNISAKLRLSGSFSLLRFALENRAHI